MHPVYTAFNPALRTALPTLAPHTIHRSGVQVSREFAEERLGRILTAGQEKSAGVVAQLLDEATNRRSVIVPREKLSFTVEPSTIALRVADPAIPDRLTFTPWAEDQLLATLHVPQKHVQRLQADGEDGQIEATRHLNALRYRIGKDEQDLSARARRMLRFVGEDVKGWLSPTYGLYDSSEILCGFAQALGSLQKQITFTDGTISDRRYSLTALYPQIIEVLPNEYIVIGGQIRTSDYGFGALDFLQNVTRIICNNGAVTTSLFRKIHRGAGYGDGEATGAFEISEKTKQLSSAAAISALTDAIRTAFSDASIQAVIDGYQFASAKEVNVERDAKALQEKGILNKEDVGLIPALISQEVEFLPETPARNSALRFGQLLSWMAGSSEGERKLQLEEAAGSYLQ